MVTYSLGDRWKGKGELGNTGVECQPSSSKNAGDDLGVQSHWP